MSFNRLQKMVNLSHPARSAGCFQKRCGFSCRLTGKILRYQRQNCPRRRPWRLIGIPTTNLEYDPQRLLPLPGIYATFAHHAGRIFPAVTNIGTNPTFITAPMANLRVESHLLDFSGDLYGSEQHLDFVKFIRPEAKFNSVDDLISRIREDIAIARQLLPPIQ